MLGNSSFILDSSLDTMEERRNRHCSKIGEYIKEDRDWLSQVTQRTTHQKNLGFIGVGLLLFSGAMLYFGLPIFALIFAALGIGTAGYIPWLHSPTKPLIFNYMPEHTHTNELGSRYRHNQANNEPPEKQHDNSMTLMPANTISEPKSKSREERLRAIGGENQVLRFNPKESQKKSYNQQSGQDTFDLIFSISQKPQNKAGRKLG